MAQIKRLLVLCVFLLVSGLPESAAAQVYTYPGDSQPGDFQSWLAGVEQEAIEKGVAPETAHAALSEATLDDRVLDRDQQQPESVLTFNLYSEHIAAPGKIGEGRALLKKYRKLLNEIGRRYGVAPQVIVALWGIESSYGRNKGSFNTVDALATLAYQGRRADFFRAQLIAALQILDQEHMDSAALRGSWAGALGQCQFIPSTYLKYAVDYDKNGKRDIWGSLPDTFASIANYIATEGWNKDLTWGRPVKLARDVPEEEIGLGVTHSLAEWSKLGVRSENGKPLPKKPLQASLVRPDGSDGRSFLVYDNFRALLKWNRSSFFAASVGLMADEIKRPR